MGQTLLGTYIFWYIAENPKRIFRVTANFLLWAWHFFSIGYFLPRIFSPWHRDISSYGRGFDLKRFLEVFGWNLISRVIGAVLRLVAMAAGIIVEVFMALVGTGAMLLWFLLPFLILVLFVLGIITLFSI
jgi:hypothetical protein